ncbi:uncharacterized protein LOC126092006 isoform X1 [Schistocerca cancellata]|uniref:uncharacterized protein LOC126092006 isoform X1 n=1 Tax=Schistocerca cancellata TaxID=274614 RepID=UPI00211996AC|nr:uncharacterized protein LOC126092006 isoform X1 [Schistocerca cancellata]
MQGTTLWEGSTCPLCKTKGINSKLKFFRLNLRVAALLCKHKKCPFPVSTEYPDTFVRVGRDGKIIPGSESERGWPQEEEDDSDDSPHISDTSEESVTFPDIFPDVKTLQNVSSENTNDKGALEVDAFDISNIDFETDDSMELRNEIISLEKEITKCVENKKAVPPHVNYKGSPVLNNYSEKCENSGTVAAKAFTSLDDNICTDTHRESGSESERGWPQEEEDDSDDSPHISDTSEESVTFPDIFPDVKTLQNVSSENTNDKGALEVDAFDISNIDFETDDSMELRNEIISLEKEITKCVENKKAVPPHVNYKGSPVLNNYSEKCENSGTVAAKAFTSLDDNICTDTHRESGTNSISCVKMNENVIEESNNRNSGNIILREHDSPTSIPRSLELTEVSEELASCMQHSEVNTLISNMRISSHKHADVQSKSKRNCRGAGHNDDSDHGDGFEEVKSTTNSNDNNVKNLEHEQTILLIPQDTKNTVGSGLSRGCELNAELVISESVSTLKNIDCDKEMCNDKEVVIIFDDDKSSECNDNDAGKQLDAVSMADTTNPEPEPLVLLNHQSTTNTVGNHSPGKLELFAELIPGVSTFNKKDNHCMKEMCEDKDVVIILDDDKNSVSTKNSVVNDLPRKCELQAELLSAELVPIQKDDDGHEVYKIVTVDSDTSSTGFLGDSRNYEVIDVQLSSCENLESTRNTDGRKTTNMHHSAQNTIEQLDKKSSITCANSGSVTPSVKIKIVEEDGLFVCKTTDAHYSVSEVEETKQVQNTSARNNAHSKNCVCFLCKESDQKGITSHLDRALADIFPEECPTDKHLKERELRTEREVMKDFLRYMTGNSSMKDTKQSLKKRKRIFHL